MDIRKLIFGVLILTFILVEGTVCKSERRHKRKNDTETEIQVQNIRVDEDLSNSTSDTEVLGGAGSPIIDMPSSQASNTTETILDSKKARKSHRLKHRRAQHKRKQHYKRTRKNKRRNQKENQAGPTDPETAGLIGSTDSEIPRDPKQVSFPGNVRDYHHHKNADKHYRRQQKRLRRRRKLLAKKDHADKIAATTDP